MLTYVDRSSSYVLGVFRIVIGFLLFCHGSAKLTGWPGGGDPVELGAWPAWWAGIIEFVCGALLVVGVGTRAAAFLASGTLAVAYFWSHQPDALLPIENNGETAALFCWALFLIVFIGPGRLTLTSLWRRESDAASTAPERSGTTGETTGAAATRSSAGV
ncbi:DoxX family protein [Gordonia soli]|uniref:DoxX family protein n=1 Tax=Gordonia soli NBRC 108243 TaxID=1223545 RepID=M0QH46_9ACTN|nr:DoxX family protein [Gordonia soli]GAC67945.1 hypothetical protein GS4_11_02140 [Gordonia soli NBRC 108243]